MESNSGFSEPFVGKKGKRTGLVLVIETLSKAVTKYRKRFRGAFTAKVNNGHC